MTTRVEWTTHDGEAYAATMEGLLRYHQNREGHKWVAYLSEEVESELEDSVSAACEIADAFGVAAGRKILDLTRTLERRDAISQHNLENAYADRDAARGIAEALRRDVEAAERHCEDLEKRNAELEAALPKLEAAIDTIQGLEDMLRREESRQRGKVMDRILALQAEVEAWRSQCERIASLAAKATPVPRMEIHCFARCACLRPGPELPYPRTIAPYGLGGDWLANRDCPECGGTGRSGLPEALANSLLPCAHEPSGVEDLVGVLCGCAYHHSRRERCRKCGAWVPWHDFPGRALKQGAGHDKDSEPDRD